MRAQLDSPDLIVESVERQFEQRRCQRAKRLEPIPAPLWQAAVQLCKSQPISRVSQRLRLSYVSVHGVASPALGHGQPAGGLLPHRCAPFQTSLSPARPGLAGNLWEADKTDGGRLARRIVAEIDSLWCFLDHEGVEPTNNRAERVLGFGVLWRKRSLGTQSEKGNRWVERILSLKETCRLKTKSTFQTLVQCIEALFNHAQPDLSWI